MEPGNSPEKRRPARPEALPVTCPTGESEAVLDGHSRTIEGSVWPAVGPVNEA